MYVIDHSHANGVKIWQANKLKPSSTVLDEKFVTFLGLQVCIFLSMFLVLLAISSRESCWVSETLGPSKARPSYCYIPLHPLFIVLTVGCGSMNRTPLFYYGYQIHKPYTLLEDCNILQPEWHEHSDLKCSYTRFELKDIIWLAIEILFVLSVIPSS